MKRTKRFLFHIFLWFAIWLIAWMVIPDNDKFITDNGPSFLVQIVIIGVLIFYTAPALLFKKKYVLFIAVSLVLLLLCAGITSDLFMAPSGTPPPFLQEPPPGRRPATPPKFLIQFLVLAIAYLIATFVETFIFAQQKEEETIRNKSENLATELKLLKSQINPHFLFNSLNNIYALSVTDSDKTQQSISTLSNMLRYVLYECEQPFVPIRKEIAYIEDYLKMFALKSSKPYPITTNFRILDKNIFIAPMLLIPFVENALKHGNIEKINNTFLRIDLYTDANEVIFKIENSVPETPSQKDEVGGIGIENVKKRLHILYPKKHKLVIKDDSATFKVHLKFYLNGQD
ncbi:sensor histidine kinase [Maribacter polysaccharolyticus]|uniref:sensor histidine kinase n=1 Tax=Maribacter polysaccharolyticus TaxID=3020831 RepID=UPI00237F1F63|nr:histidine kinase [Maribacter polysaccharolyticus]MDE3742397.1 histidine kinase [Maribacter polysaccharolyticus]